MKNFMLKDPNKWENYIKINHDSIVDFSNKAGVNYSTVYRLLRGQRSTRPSAIKFTDGLKKDGNKVEFKNIFLLK